MKNNLIIGNWKMNLTPKESVKLINDFLKLYNPDEAKGAELVICPPFLSIEAVSKKIAKTSVKLGAQDCFWENKGAFTGEVSPRSLKELGVEYVIIGHSERREYARETDRMVNLKVKTVLANNLIPIICVGEKFEQRQSGEKEYVVMQQLEQALVGVELSEANRVVVAYEPVWVIGSGQAVFPEEAEHTNQVLRQVILDHFSPAVFEKQFSLIYGGSVDSNNIKNFVSQPTVHGSLIGGASLKADELWKMTKNLSQ